MRSAVAALLVGLPFVVGAASAADGPARHEVFRFADPAIVESSALVVVPGAFVTVNDSGDSARVFSVDPRTGRTVGVTSWDGGAVDDEALAPAADDGFVWVGDIGDNTGSRDDVSVVEVPVGGGDRSVPGDRYTLTYPHGRSSDAETLLCDPRTGRLFVVTKGVFGGDVYAAPRTLRHDRPNLLRSRGSVLPIATDGAFFPDGQHVILRDYSRAVVYDWPSLEEVGEVPLPRQPQGEGLAVDADGQVFVSSEGQHQPVYRVPLPAAVQRVVGPTTRPSASRSGSPSGSASASPYSREGRELPEDPSGGRSPWQWLLGTGVLVGAFVVLARALRPR